MKEQFFTTTGRIMILHLLQKAFEKERLRISRIAKVLQGGVGNGSGMMIIVVVVASGKIGRRNCQQVLELLCGRHDNDCGGWVMGDTVVSCRRWGLTARDEG